MIAVSLDGDGYFVDETEVGTNTGDGFGLPSSNVLRVLIRAAAEAFLIVLNKPTGKPRLTPDLVQFAERSDQAGEAVGILLRDLVVIGARDTGWLSFAAEGIVGAGP